MAQTIILGAGLTGLSAAYHLEISKTPYAIFEKEDRVGGLCRSVRTDGYTFDYTGHLLHVNDAYFQTFISSLFDGAELENIVRRSFIYSHGVFTRYPFQTNLYGLPADVIAQCIAGYVNREQKEPVTFYDWVHTHFGAGLAKHFFLPYNQKLWCTDAKDMEPSWTGRFVPKTSLEDMIAGSQEDRQQQVGYNSSFYYPSAGGIDHLPQKLASKLQTKIHTNHTVTKIDLVAKQVHFANGRVEPYEKLITTLPLDALLGMLHEPPSLNIAGAKDNLRCTALVNFNLGLNVPDVTDEHWLYFPEKQYPFYRLGCWSNFTSSMAPAGASSLYGEWSYIPGERSRDEVEAITRKAITQALELFGLNTQHVALEKILHLAHAYVVYSPWRKENLQKILSCLAEHDIVSVGRFGAWKYSSMQEAVLDGRDVAGRVARGESVQK